MNKNEGKISSRGLSQKFMGDLKLGSGVLSPILQQVLKDKTLDLQIRDNYINIYYRGGNLIKITEKPGGYSGDFDAAYMKDASARNDVPTWNNIFPYPIENQSTASELVLEMMPFMKAAMEDKVKSEREFQQLTVRENNYSPISNDTDYTICDIEYTHTDHRELRFDLIAAHWPSKGQIRKKPDSMKLALVEMKYGDGALKGPAGIQSHYANLMKAFAHISILCTEMTTVTKQKAELGIIQTGELNKNDIDRIGKIKISADKKPEWILLLSNHDPEKSTLQKELIWLKNKSEEDNFPFEIKIAVSNFMGYGLYEDCISPLSEFLEKFMPEKSNK